MKEEEERNQVARVFENMGADKESAQRMAGQLIKRADQKAEENKTTRIIELQKLLELSIYGAQGLLKPDQNGGLEGK
tara:strand:- start:105 stop:335 length:231 start_codon:yes stop_codon:yes gene_type:complete